MTGPAIIKARSVADLGRVRIEAEAALRAGRAVNVFADLRGASSLMVRVLPLQSGYLALTPAVSTTGQRPGVEGALHRPLAMAAHLFEGGVPQSERWRS